MESSSPAVTTPEELPILCGLSDDHRRRIMENTMLHTVPAGTVLFEQGDTPNFQIVVMSGSVQLFGRSTSGREVLVEVVSPPDLIIPAAVVTGAPYLMRARVPEPSTFLLIQARTFRDLVASDLSLANSLIGSLSTQFRRMVRQIKNLKLRSAVQRIGCYLLTLSERQGTPEKAVLPYEKNLIASELGITRESFSRVLASLEKHGIRIDGQTIWIDDAERLAKECVPDPLIDDRELGFVLGD
ncbi:Crp/Fnr family transcriptional regulator [Pleomorphomonas carboxyditropha]|uniref:Crp/Fnr family transcriptional regulator n=2 Tax=Pleomorphomonas TaxID=261933 RepID=A0A2G9WNX7_9HYPH|nr:Crp/Fnr family transcriptional regulator [Pleomorphomonas carboxyditropha]